MNTDIGILQKNANAGDPVAIWELAKAYYEGIGLEINKDKALPLLLESAQNKIQEAYQYISMYLAPASENDSSFNLENARKLIEQYAMEGDGILLSLLVQDRLQMVNSRKKSPEENIEELKKALVYIRRAKNFGELSPIMKKYEQWIYNMMSLQERAIELNQDSLFYRIKKFFKM